MCGDLGDKLNYVVLTKSQSFNFTNKGMGARCWGKREAEKAAS